MTSGIAPGGYFPPLPQLCPSSPLSERELNFFITAHFVPMTES